MAVTVTYSTAVSFSKLSSTSQLCQQLEFDSRYMISFNIYLVQSLRSIYAYPPGRSFRWIVYSLIGTVGAYTIAYEMVIIFRCRPISAVWDLTVEGYCIPSETRMMVLSVANITIDLIILVIPIRVLAPLKMPAKPRISLVLIFAAGGL